jgi:aspartyl-tRNA(Asn)/glutamyl-tRNA(Gln) amidotransferase subunit B
VDLGVWAFHDGVLTADVDSFRRFEELLEATSAKLGKGPKDVSTQVANWSLSVAPGVLNALGSEADEGHATAEAQAAILAMQSAGEISGGQAKEIYEIVLKTGREPAEIAETEGLKQQSDTGAIEAEIDKVLAANTDKVAEYRGGKDKLFGFFVGQTMKAMAGKGNPAVVNQLLKAKLDG